MGLVRGMARTAVVAGTATAVSNRVSRRQANRWEQQAYEQQAAAPQAPPPQPPPQQTQYFAPPPQAPPSGGGADAGGDLTADLTRLAEMRSQGLLTDEEFAAAKARLLGQ
jgi:hypothetical protein